MGCCLTATTFLFLMVSFGAEIISFLTSFMVLNRLGSSLHDGIFQRCGAINYYNTALNAQGSFITHHASSYYEPPSGCFWWNSAVFDRDEKSLQATVVLAFISCAVMALATIFFFISMVERFKNKSLHIFLGVLVIINGILIIGIILMYTFIYAKEARIWADVQSPLLFGWSYWLLYGAASGNFITSILFCFTPARTNYYD